MLMNRSLLLGSTFQQFLLEFADKPFKVELDKKYRALATGHPGRVQRN
jgi:hypothetical protein